MDKQQVLRQYFGHDAFREGQERLIDALLAGRDVLGVMPTGAGKSLCYQIPALMLDGVTLVVSPLISLMKDQVAALKASGVPAAFINSSLTSAQQAEALRRARLGAYKIIYVAPERLDLADFRLFAQSAGVSLVAVDEAHCVSQWGQDFRPSYREIAGFVDCLPARPPIGAFTATATERVRQDIVRLLRLRDDCEKITTGFDRPNLRFISQKPDHKYPALCRALDRHEGESVIVYCSARKTVDQLLGKLARDGYSVTGYHAGMSDEERRRNQEDFQYGRCLVMAATNAFGMGIDKPDVRCVVHYNMPKDIESYYQEAGRAGRDGDEAECVLLYGGQDVHTARWLIENGEENADLTEEERAQVRKTDYERLRRMTFYSTSKNCLRAYILRYFGEKPPARCGNCSVCLSMPFETKEQEKKKEKRAAPVKQAALRDASQQALYDKLAALRARLAGKTPAYMVFANSSLRDMVEKMPVTPREFGIVEGVGKIKQEKYGDAFLRVIRESGMAPSEAKPWTEEEEETLMAEYLRGDGVPAIATSHKRTPADVCVKLYDMGVPR